MVYLGRFFSQTEIFAGFSLHIINSSEGGGKGWEDIVFHSFGAPRKDTPSYCDFTGFIAILYIVFAARISEAAWAGWRSENIISGLHFRG